MRLSPEFLLRIAKASELADEGVRMMSIIIQRPYINLEKELRSTFEGQEDVNVIVDRRYAERRTSRRPIEIDRRRSDRRGSKEELVEVVIST